VLIVAGPGNNGGDAFVVARHLQGVVVHSRSGFCRRCGQLPQDAKAAYDAWRRSGGTEHEHIPPARRWDLVIDGLFGIGLKRELSGVHAELADAINSLGTTVLSLDVPSGLDSDRGGVLGRAVRATHTATFIALKPGLLTLDGPDHCGKIPFVHARSGRRGAARSARRIGRRRGDGIGAARAPRQQPQRRLRQPRHHRGARGMIGAALLSGRAAINLGAGRVYVGLLDHASAGFDPLQPELMLRAADEVLKLDHLNCLAVGPGLGLSPPAHQRSLPHWTGIAAGD
jgi:hydroxyethylthiazole kinase-like uncharacterized protein yjeF